MCVHGEQYVFEYFTGVIVLGWMCVTTFNVVWIGVLIKTPGWRPEVYVIHKNIYICIQTCLFHADLSLSLQLFLLHSSV